MLNIDFNKRIYILKDDIDYVFNKQKRLIYI